MAVPWALEAQRILAEEWNVRADVWSATSWNELRRDAIAVEEHNLLHPEEEQRVPYVTHEAPGCRGPVRGGLGLDARGAGPDLPLGARAPGSRWAPTASASPTPVARRGASSTSTRSRSCWAVLTELAREGKIDRSALKQAIDRYQLLDVAAADPGPAGGDA